MEKRLSDAAQAGGIDALYALLAQDPFLVNSIDDLPFHQTPLHLSALAGQTCFSLELANLKPSLTRKLNQDGYSPIHLASTAGHVETVRGLLEFNSDLGVVKGREWRVPLHSAAIAGRFDVVGVLLSIRPDCINCLTVRKETALHLALKHDQIEAFGVLLERITVSKAEEIVNWTDREGNTVLHLAIYKKQFQIVELLLNTDRVCKVVEINIRNKNGFTALDILRQQSLTEPSATGVETILRDFGAVTTGQDTLVSISPSHSPHFSTQTNNCMKPLIIMEKLLQGFPMEDWAKEIQDCPSETRSALMVVAVLIASVTFQVVLSPPRPLSDTFDFAIIFVVLFVIINLIGFFTSLAMITVLTRGFPLKALLRISVLSLAATYICAIPFILIQSPVPAVLITLSMTSLILVQGFHLQMRSWRKFKRFPG